MYTPRVRLRITAYHMVEASLVPWMRCHGGSTEPSAAAMPASTSWR
jgi:hypothetical protein